MQPVPPHLLPFVGACIVKVIVGALWYSSLLFLKPWQRGAGVSDEQVRGGMAKGMSTWILGAVIMTFEAGESRDYGRDSRRCRVADRET